MIRRHGFVQLDKPSRLSPVPGLLATKKKQGVLSVFKEELIGIVYS